MFACELLCSQKQARTRFFHEDTKAKWNAAPGEHSACLQELTDGQLIIYFRITCEFVEIPKEEIHLSCPSFYQQEWDKE